MEKVNINSTTLKACRMPGKLKYFLNMNWKRITVALNFTQEIHFPQIRQKT
jgi:hypothetical protein